VLLGGAGTLGGPAVARLNFNGTADTTFGVSGVSRPRFGDQGLSHVIDMAFGPSGRIRLAVDVASVSLARNVFGFATLGTTGALEPNRFGHDVHGEWIDVDAKGGHPKAIAVAGDKVVLAGTATSATDQLRAAVVQLFPDRTQDLTFDQEAAKIRATMTTPETWIVADRALYAPNNLDVALLHLTTGVTMSGSTSGFMFSGFAPNIAGLTDTLVDCRGYGNNVVAMDGTQSGFGTLRQGTVRVQTIFPEFVRVESITWIEQIAARGDSGSSCFAAGKPVGVASVASPTTADYVRADLFSQWALTNIATP
jgi:hypothetical protein